MPDHQQAYALVDAFCVVTHRPDGRGAIIDGARDIANRPLGMLTVDDGVADALRAELDLTSNVAGALSVDGTRIDLVRLGGTSVLTDGRGRHFDILSRRPVDIDGNRVSLAHAEHLARNWASRRAKQLRKAA